MRISRLLAASALALAACLPFGAAAQPWPNKPIKFIVPFAAGGVADVVTRAVRHKGELMRLSRADIATSSISAMAGKPPASS